MTSDAETERSFSERVEEVKQEIQGDGGQKPSSERVEETKDERQEGDAQSTDTSTEDVEMGQAKAVISIVVTLFTLGFMGAALANGQPGLGLLALAGAVGAWMIFTEEGREAGREMMSEIGDTNQRQTDHESNKREERRICSDCGWQNPARNTYCNDCGTKLRANE